MSGIGEVLAIVSCVAGLIQAYDAGSRIVRQIKARRQAHGALPPSDLLEQSIDKGKREIQQLVEDGRQRFGPSFEEGDSEYQTQHHHHITTTVTNITNLLATAQLALYKITIATQQALLDGLTQARDDDGIIDFDYCIDTSDKGRNEALLALHQLFQRKLEEEMERKRSNPSRPSPAPASVPAPEPYTSPPSYQHAALQKEVESPASAQKEEEQPPSPLPKIKKSRTFGQSVFRRKSSNNQDNSQSKKDATGSDKLAQMSPTLSQQEIKPSLNRRNTTTSMLSNATWSSTSTDSTVGRPRSIERSNTSASSITMVSRRDTTFSTMSGMSSMSAMSAMSNMSISPITKYGACCKYAYELREGNIKKGLMLQLAGFYGGHAFYSCASTKCQYQSPAAQDKKGYKMDNRVFNTPEGIKYRWLFLAKSHAQQKDPRFPSFRCLVCILSKDDSAFYDGKESLFAHLADHQGAFLGDTLIGGQLIFDNHGAKLGQDSDFDVRFPELAPIEPPVQEQGVAVVVSATLPLDTHRLAPNLPTKTPSVAAYPYESDDNPWIN